MSAGVYHFESFMWLIKLKKKENLRKKLYFKKVNPWSFNISIITKKKSYCFQTKAPHKDKLFSNYEKKKIANLFDWCGMFWSSLDALSYLLRGNRSAAEFQVDIYCLRRCNSSFIVFHNPCLLLFGNRTVKLSPRKMSEGLVRFYHTDILGGPTIVCYVNAGQPTMYTGSCLCLN